MPKGSVIMIDEFVLGGLSTDMGALQNALIQKFTLIRKKQLFIVLILPYMWMTRTYFAVGRCKSLLHIFSPDFLQRGNFKYYGFKKKHKLYFNGMVTTNKWQYNIRPDFVGHFGSDIGQENFFTDDKEYEAKKDEATQNIGKNDSKGEKFKGEKSEPETKFKLNVTCPSCKVKNKILWNKEDGSRVCTACNTPYGEIDNKLTN